MKTPRTLFFRAALRWAGRHGARPLIEGVKIGAAMCVMVGLTVLAMGA
jgi:hypothetical protein